MMRKPRCQANEVGAIQHLTESQITAAILTHRNGRVRNLTTLSNRDHKIIRTHFGGIKLDVNVAVNFDGFPFQ